MAAAGVALRVAYKAHDRASVHSHALQVAARQVQMYADDDTATFTVPPIADDAPSIKLVVQQTLEEADLCSIFDDAWLGSRVWEATEHFCRFMCTDLRSLFRDASVLDLGAGTGILGLVAAALESREVLITDMASPAGTLNLVLANIARNVPLLRCSGADGTASARAVRGAALDWGTIPTTQWEDEFVPEGKFDVIVAAECIYTGIDGADEVVGREAWVLLAETINRLSGPTTTIFVCSMERHDACVSESAGSDGATEQVSLVLQFADLMKTNGFVANFIWRASRPPNQRPWLIQFRRVAESPVAAGT